MAFDIIRQLRKHEAQLDRGIDAASKQLAGGAAEDRLAKAFRAGRAARHPCWATFLKFARPIDEARQHIAAEREWLEIQVEQEIRAGVDALKRRKTR